MKDFKAEQIVKRTITAEQIIEEIKDLYPTHFKYFIPHFLYVSNQVQVELSMMGFKVTYGEWSKGEKGLIIEW